MELGPFEKITIFPPDPLLRWTAGIRLPVAAEKRFLMENNNDGEIGTNVGPIEEELFI